MTPEQLTEIEQRWAKATKGPWVADMRPVATECGECGEYAYEVPGVIRRKSDGCGIVDVQESEKQNENAEAIAKAPTDIQALLAEVRRLNRMVDKAVEMLYAEIDCPLDKNGIRKYLESEVVK